MLLGALQRSLRQLERWPRSALLLRVLLCAGVGLAMVSCNAGVSNPFASEGQLTSITISGDSIIQFGASTRLSAYGKVSGITGLLSYDRLLDAVWSVSDSTVARITPISPAPGDSTATAAALVQGLRAGSARITATARGVSGTIEVRVTGT